MEPVLILGAGMAAYGVARELRKRDPAVRISLISRDSAASYSKPMLSNALALGRTARQLLAQDARQMAASLDAQIINHTQVLSIDTAARHVLTNDGAHSYGKLVLALGADPIRLPLAGDAAARVLSVNHIDDYALLREHLDALGRPARIAILGAGLIGCEFADDLSSAGHSVLLIDPNPRPLAALAAPALSQGLIDAWRTRPITLKLGTTATAVDVDSVGYVLQLADGSSVQADLVVSAVGLRPATTLARAAGLQVARGIQVDAFGRSSDEHIFALGDCAEYAGGRVLPYVAPMLTAARAIAATLAGTPTPIDFAPDAIVVKTLSYKLALAPPPAGSEGGWHSEQADGHTIARFLDRAGVLRGFGLAPPTAALRSQLLAALSAG